MADRKPPPKTKAKRVAASDSRVSGLASTSEQTLERLCDVAADLLGVPTAVLTLNQNGVSRVVASSGAPEQFRSYRWAFDESSYGPSDRAIVPDASARPVKQRTAQALGLQQAGFFMRCPVVVDEGYVLSLLLIDESPRNKPTQRQLRLIDEVIALMRDVFSQAAALLTDVTADVTVPKTLAQICTSIASASHAEVLLDANLKAIAASKAMADMLGTHPEALLGRRYDDFQFSGAEPIGLFCRTALQTRLSPPDFEVTVKPQGRPRRIFQIAVSPFSPVDTRDYFLHFRVSEVTARSAREAQLAMLAHRPGADQDIPEPTFAFLKETLVERRSLRARKDLTYLTLRSWRQPIRAYQIKALKALKLNVPPAMATDIAKEIAAEIGSLVGASAFRAIVPIPCGHTRDAPCLSVEIARALGLQLDLPVVQAFAAQPQRGSSHPKEIKRRPPLTLIREIYEPVLLVDDVATSGAHLEEAAALLRRYCKSLLAVAWIGGDAT